MRTRTQRLAIAILAFAVTFTSLPMMTEGISAHAATYKKPAQVKGVEAAVKSSTFVRLSWKKAARTNKGYVIYRNGEKFKVRGKKYLYLDIKNLKPATKYSFQVCAYNKYLRKQYYNTTTKKWQYKKPASRNWKTRKTRKGNYYKYGKISSTVTAVTPPATPAKVTGVTASALSSSSIKVSWTGLSKNVTSYAIYRDGTNVGSVPKGTNSFTDKGLEASTSYTYQVRAYNYSTTVKKGKYGVYSDKKTAKTAGTGVKDALFADSKMANKTLYIEKNYNGSPDLVWELKTSGEDADSIKWKSDNESVVTVQRAVMIGTKARLTIVGKGTAKITATNWDGQIKTATVTVKSTADDVVEQPTDEETDNGIITDNGKVYPNNDGVFELKNRFTQGFEISDVDVSFSNLISAFPTGSTFSVNARDSIKETPYDNVTGAASQVGLAADIVSITNKSVAIDTTPRGRDTSTNGLFFLNAGKTSITFGNGKTFTFIVTGRNDAMCAYQEYVRRFVNANAGKTDMEITLAAISQCVDMKYGPSNDPYTMVTASSNPGGNCFAKAMLLQRLLSECGIKNYLHMSYYLDSNGEEDGRHMVNEVIIDGVAYTADPTNSRQLFQFSWESGKTDYEIKYNAQVNKNRVDSLDPVSILK